MEACVRGSRGAAAWRLEARSTMREAEGGDNFLGVVPVSVKTYMVRASIYGTRFLCKTKPKTLRQGKYRIPQSLHRGIKMRRRGQEVEADDRAEAQAERRRKALAETWRGVERRWAEEAEDRRHARRRRALLPLGRLCPSPPPPFSGRRRPRRRRRGKRSAGPRTWREGRGAT